MKLRAFVTDVDGTVTDSYPVVDIDAASTLMNLEKLGYRVVLASGRAVWELYSLSMFLGLCKVVVGENGGVVVNADPTRLMVLGDVQHPIEAMSYLEGRMVGLKLKRTLPRFSEVVLERTVDLTELRKHLAGSGIPVKALDSGYAYHLVCDNVDKALGVEKALGALGIGMEEAVAIGDSETDVPLFEKCAFGIAVGNSDEHAVRAADHVTKAKSGQGAVEAVTYALENLMG